MQLIRQQLEDVFDKIATERMHDVPVCNPNLQVRALGFEIWGEFFLGVMLTPWFMNLMLLPQKSEKFDGFLIGEKQTHVFPSGHYEFVTGEEEGIGRYQVCSLFSPVFEFRDQQTAEETARTVLEEIMQTTNYYELDSLQGQPGESKPPKNEQNVEQSLETVVSRRDFLRGRLTGRRGNSGN